MINFNKFVSIIFAQLQISNNIYKVKLKFKPKIIKLLKDKKLVADIRTYNIRKN